VLCSAPPRLSYLAADIFAPWPVHADAVVLARVLHDWDDAHALRILQQARATLAAGGRLFIVEMLLTDENPGGSLCDLHVLMTTGGQERRLGEYQALLAQAGFAYVALRRLPALPVVIVGEAQ
jgi:SAM-dependent methyltransferase